jgi:mannose-6-phosphate isomerase-like protein (cupin superfamily)
MRHLIAIERADLAPGARSNLLDRREGLSADIARGSGVKSITIEEVDRYLFVLEGAVSVVLGAAREVAEAETLITVPAGARLTLFADASATWLEFRQDEQPLTLGSCGISIARADPDRFEGEGFNHQMLAGRSTGSSARVNALRVDPGAGSPDFHIHDFDQYYVVLEGEMQVDIGHRRYRAGPMTLVVLPAGLVHRNFNAGPTAERHISLLVPEPLEDAIFDYAVEILDQEAAFFDVPTALTSATS